MDLYRVIFWYITNKRSMLLPFSARLTICDLINLKFHCLNVEWSFICFSRYFLSVGGLRNIFWCLQLKIECKASASDDFNMQMVQQVSLECDTCLHPETFMCKDGLSGVTQHPAAALSVIPSNDHPASQQSVLTHDHTVTQLVPSSQDQVMLQQPGTSWK